MTFDEFKKDFFMFLKNSTVNLGRRATKTRQAFLDEAAARFYEYESGADQVDDSVKEQPEISSPTSGSILRIKPADKRRALDVGKGVHAMTSSESGRADEERNHPPMTSNAKKGNK